jgi:hypothetical protein
MQLVKNLDLLALIMWLTSGKLKKNWQSDIISLDVVLNIFIKVLLMTKFIDLSSVVLTGHASKPYRRQGKHFALTRLNITSSEAVLPILP